jgi:hypothetical protein
MSATKKSDVSDHLMVRSLGPDIQVFPSENSVLLDKSKQRLIKEEIKRRMERRYVKYFKHWKDYEMLTCILSMIGLILAMVEVRAVSL